MGVAVHVRGPAPAIPLPSLVSRRGIEAAPAESTRGARRGHDFGCIGVRPDDADRTRDDGPGQAPGPGPKQVEGKSPASTCKVASGPTYTPRGTIPVKAEAGRKVADTFALSATFVTDPKAGYDPSCCQVRQYIEWDKAHHDYRRGPPHKGFPADASHGAWIEDRDKDDTARYGHRSGPFSKPVADCGDEYRTGDKQDMLHGNTYCGLDQPMGPPAKTGQYQFQLKVVDWCAPGTPERAASSIIAVNW
jgi:hypothetical protein